MSANRGDTICECGLRLGTWPGLGRLKAEDLMLEREYLAAIDYSHCSYANNHGRGWTEHGQARFRKVVCPLCRLEYVGWYNLTPWSEDKLWEMYDTSWWSTFGDDPAKEDRRNWRDPELALLTLDAMDVLFKRLSAQHLLVTSLKRL